jgi:MOSC domain-containing protein YiiM
MHTTEDFPSETELTARLDLLREAPAGGNAIEFLVRRPATDQRELPAEARLSPAAGMVGDRWAATCSHRLPSGKLDPDSQITIMNTRMLAALTNDRSRWPLAGDNILVDLNLSEANLPVGQRLRVGTAVLEITARPHTGCSKFAKRFGPAGLKFVNSPEGTFLRLRGVHARVVRSGIVKVGDAVRKVKQAVKRVAASRKKAGSEGKNGRTSSHAADAKTRKPRKRIP